MDDPDRHTIRAGSLAATIKADGAELCSLTDAGVEFVWQAGPAWPRHAPILFPIVGRLRDDTLRHAGQAYRLTQHGFARDRRFAWMARDADSCRLALVDDAASREIYPFAFRLEAAYALVDGALDVTLEVTNTGAEMLPASVGTHTALVWPLRPEVAKDAHALAFEHPEPAPVRRLEAGLLLPDPFPSPVEAGVLALSERLFAGDAIILDHLASRSVRYACPGGPSVTMAWRNCPQLGLWSRAGGEFLCIEPWYGFASPTTFEGDFVDKPGLMLVAPGDTASIGFSIVIGKRSDDD